jgi:hypothetical protein
MLVKVIYSEITKISLNNLLKRKNIRRKINTENHFLKELIFFGGAIQGESQKKLNENKKKLKLEDLEINNLKKDFKNNYQLDYEKSYKKSKEDLMIGTKIEVEEEVSKEVKSLKYILKVTEGYIDFGEKLNQEIKKRIDLK